MDYKGDLQSDDDFDCSNGYGDSFNNNSNSNSGYGGSGRMANPNGLSKAELRKTNKPIMEKRRRARINHCLNELKSLILEAMKKDPARHTKLEKADILEMTVKHLQSVQRQQLNMAIQTDPSVIHKFKTGFVECAEEVNRYVSQLDGVDVSVRQRLSSHLNSCATSLEQIGSMTNFNNGYRGQLGVNTGGLFGSALHNPLAAVAAATTVAPAAALFPPLPQDLNNNNNSSSNHAAPIQMGGVQLIPSRLPSGEFALIMPNTNATVAAASILNNNNHSNSVNNNNNNTPFGAWAAGAAQLSGNGAPQINDFASNLQRMSAFTTPQAQPHNFNTSAVTINNNNSNNSSDHINDSQKVINNNNNNNSTNTSSHNFTTTHATAFHQPENNLHHNTTATTSPPLSPISSASLSSHGDDSSIMHTSSDFAHSRPATPPYDAASQHNFAGVFTTPPSSAESSLTLSHSSSHLQQQQVSSTSGSDLNASLKRPLTDVADSSDSSDEPSSKKFATAPAEEKEGGDESGGLEERDSMWRPW